VTEHYDIIIVGGGHAGIEAAAIAARMGARVALISMKHDAIGRMSCNPAIGGIGKGQMVREIDALGGLMGIATDRAGIQFRMLNRSKGPAVWAPRAQCDRDRYPKVVQELLGEVRNLEILEGSVETIETIACGDTHESIAGKPWRLNAGPSRVTGVILADGRKLKADAVILTTGTFLRGLMHCGSDQSAGGRIGEAAAVGLSAALASLGFELGRLKTGTPPRVHRDSIRYDVCDVQPGDDPPTPFSDMTDGIRQPQVPCWVTWTNESVHEPIRANLHRAPMYSGQIQSRGPRYCPSIEDKVVRFSDKPRHQVFLEPEGYDNERVYCNGISTSLPKDVQEDFVHQVPGLESAEILQYGYAVEYDFVPTHQTNPSLESKLVGGLFFAGQINGTSGYEEAAGQGIMAGINAAQHVRGHAPIVLGRDQAYIGVMIDDLVTKPPTEPYRMFTSRAEYRLLLRSDNTDARLTPLGRRLGTVDDERWERFRRKQSANQTFSALADRARVNGMLLSTWMRRPDTDLAALATLLAPSTDQIYCTDTLTQALNDAKYSGYIRRQEDQVARFRRLEDMNIPPRVDYRSMSELRHEARESFTRVAPRTLGQASRVSGINPADITILWVYLTGRRELPKSA